MAMGLVGFSLDRASTR